MPYSRENPRITTAGCSVAMRASSAALPPVALGVGAPEVRAVDRDVDRRARRLGHHDERVVLLVRQAVDRREPLQGVRVAEEHDALRELVSP